MRLLLVTGSMRSGTSSLAGSLSMLGWHVPKPEVPAEPRTPRGHFEPQWVVRFHTRHLAAARVRPSDSSPAARERVAAVLADGSVADELAGWLAEQTEPDIVVKDPHALWFTAVWIEVAERCGRDLRLLTALRQPAEVVGSKELAWGFRRDDTTSLAKETANVASWLHNSLVAEASGRSRPQAFVRYVDLLADWRSALSAVSRDLDLDLPVPPPGTHHLVDDFLDTGLRNSRVGFDDLTVPPRLRALAERAWSALDELRTSPADASARAELDEIDVEYAALYAESRAITLDEQHHAARLASQQKAAKLRPRITALRERVARQQERIADLEADHGRAGGAASAVRARVGRAARRGAATVRSRARRG